MLALSGIWGAWRLSWRPMLRQLALLQSELNEPVGPVLAVEVTAGRNDILELRRWDWQTWDNVPNPARLLVEVPHEFAPGGLLGVALAVFGVDLDARTEENQLMRRDERHPMH